MIQQIIRSGLACALAVGLGGCGDSDGDGPGVEGYRHRNPRDVDVPTVVTSPLLNPVLEFPLEMAWQAYYFVIDSPSRIRGEVGLPVDRWVAPAPGQAIADVGAGGGYYTFRYASLVGPGGFVQAVDADWRASRKMAWEAQQRGAGNVLVTQVPVGELGLEAGRFDTVLMISTGMLLSCDRGVAQNYLAQIARALRPGGQLIYIDPLDVRGSPQARPCAETSGLGVIERVAPYFAVEEQVAMGGGSGGPSVAIRFRLRDAAR